MRFFHLSDLHIGKQFHYYNLKEDQEYILCQVIEATKKYRPDAIVIAGDIYDKSVPSAEAVSIFNGFLTELADIKPEIPVLIVAGNHDSPQRLDFASEILGRQKIHIAGLPPRASQEFLKKVTLEDQHGEVNFYLLPFAKPEYVTNILQDTEEQIDTTKRNVIISHQFYTSGNAEPLRSDSETVIVGGLDNVDVSLLRPFDYAALGHIHRAQSIGCKKNRYCGTLLKYSVSEEKDEKALLMVELQEKGSEANIHKIKLHPLREVRRIRGLFEEIIDNQENCQDYVSITITDEVEPYRMRERLEEVFPYLLEIRVDNTRTRTSLTETEEYIDISDPLQVFGDFFKEMQGREMTEEEQKLLNDIMEEAEE